MLVASSGMLMMLLGNVRSEYGSLSGADAS